jgi:hypothetical protein
VWWVLSGNWLMGWLAVVLGIAACVAMWYSPDKVVDDIGVTPHPLDPQQEANRRARMALGQMRRRYRHTRDEERGL